MYANLYTLLTRPDRAWTTIREDEERNSASYLPYLLLFSLLPAVCLFIGTRWVGWSLVDEERIRLETTSALQLSVLLYLGTLAGVLIMGGFLRYMSRTFEANPTFNQCIGFIAYACTPFFLAGIAALYPTRWLAIGVLALACAHACYLIYVGLPRFMRIDNQQGFLYASSMIGVGLLVIVTILVSMILFWTYTLEPDYQRTVQQDRSHGTQEQRMQAPGDE
ncbi:YIP1 family protein [Pseudomonas sp. B11D7D]|nr:Yip1 family protein [Pseudomonas sp. B11D7D]QNH03691.1 YIP1 family protein [Pseudomonas sp. B11D7D]